MRSRLTFIALAITLAAPGALLAEDEPAPATDGQMAQFAGEYRDVNSFEMFHGLLLKEDGTFEWAMSVGAMDRRSAGTWAIEDGYGVLTTSPAPTAPEFVREDDDPAQDAPFLMVSWPGGDGIPGINFTLICDDGKMISHYTQHDGWDKVPGECDAPSSISLEETIQDIGPAYFNLEGETGSLRFTLVPNDFGIMDLSGTLMERTETGLRMYGPEFQSEMRRVER